MQPTTCAFVTSIFCMTLKELELRDLVQKKKKKMLIPWLLLLCWVQVLFLRHYVSCRPPCQCGRVTSSLRVKISDAPPLPTTHTHTVPGKPIHHKASLDFLHLQLVTGDTALGRGESRG